MSIYDNISLGYTPNEEIHFLPNSIKKIAVTTGSRAEYGLLKPLIKKINDEKSFALDLIATGSHLSEKFGNTYQEIEGDGFNISKKIEIPLNNDTNVDSAIATGTGTIRFAEYFSTNKPDLAIVLGDRFEIMAAAQAALFLQIPIAHICGGDITEGAIDESIRHCVTKMSHLHFPTNKDSYNRIIQLGENPENVHQVGHLGIDGIKNITYIEKAQLEKELKVSLQEINYLITFHPETLSNMSAKDQVQNLLDALDKIPPAVGLIFTMPNSDPGGREIAKQIGDFIKKHPNAYSFISLGQRLYLNTLKHVDMVIGNSSSGLMEAGSFNIPTVNIGDRQKGRLSGDSVLNCKLDPESILNCISSAQKIDCSNATNPYGNGDSANKIVSALKTYPNFNSLLKKPFYNYARE